MSRKDYERAAHVVQHLDDSERDTVTEAFCRFFYGDNPRFDEGRFRRACVPGANVKART
jgi:hypothetical protein